MFQLLNLPLQKGLFRVLVFRRYSSWTYHLRVDLTLLLSYYSTPQQFGAFSFLTIVFQVDQLLRGDLRIEVSDFFGPKIEIYVKCV